MSIYQRRRVRLERRHREKLKSLLSKGVQSVRVVGRALVLTQLHEGRAASQVAASVQLSEKAVREIGRRYENDGLDRALYDKQRPGAKPILDDNQRQRIIAMVCSDPPEGRARWTVPLIAEEAVKRKLVSRVGREAIRILLLHHDLQPWREKNVVRRGAGSDLYRKDGGRAGGLREAVVRG
jgi:transposase